MQALIATSRSISQDPFLDRQNKRKYDQHVKKVEDIKDLKLYPILSQVKQTQKMTQTLYKAKQSARTFRDNQQKIQIKRQNRILLQKIWKINSNLNTDSSVMHLQHQSGSNWVYKKKLAETIKFQNKRLASNLINTKADVKQYKKKLENQIKQYLQLRNNIRKFNIDGQKKKKMSRVQSERKGFKLTLKQMQQEQNNKEADGNTQRKEKQERKNNLNNSQQKKFRTQLKIKSKAKSKSKIQVQKQANDGDKQKPTKKQQINNIEDIPQVGQGVID